jgi:putative SOS response-associated peptidase YedK
MCGRITQKTGELPGFVTVMGGPDDSRTRKPRYNVAPGQEHWVIRYHAKSGQYRRDRLLWGLVPHWAKDPSMGRRLVLARAETISATAAFKDAYRRRRALVPIDNFFEWAGKKGTKGRQPYALAMKDRKLFAVAAVWDAWRKPGTDDPWLRTFAIVTCAPNELVATIHDRMPVIVPPEHYERWLMNIEPDPGDIMVPYPAELMDMWKVDKRMNKADADDAGILDRIDD